MSDAVVVAGSSQHGVLTRGAASQTVHVKAATNGQTQVVAAVVQNGSTITSASMSGWTLLESQKHPSGETRILAFYRVSGAGGLAEADHTLTLSAALVEGAWLSFVVDGAIDKEGFLANNTTWATALSTYSIPDVTYAGSLLVRLITTNQYPRTLTPPGTMTLIASDGDSGSSPIYAAYRAVSGGATGSDGWTADSVTLWMDIAIAFAPLAPSSSPTLTGDGELPTTYAVTALNVALGAPSIAPTGTTLATVTDQNGLPVAGATVTSGSPAVASATTPTNGSGQSTLTGLAAGNAVITATLGSLSASASIAVAVAAAPPAPTAISATVLGATVTVSWTSDLTNATGQDLQRSADGGTTWAALYDPIGNIAQGALDSFLPAGTYRYRVRSKNGTGNSAWLTSAPITVAGASDAVAPTVTLIASATTITAPGTLTLSASAADNVGVASVQIYRDGIALGPAIDAPGPYQTSVQISGAASNGTHVFSARAFDAAGNVGISADVTVTIAIPVAPQIPAAPSGLVSTAQSASSVSLAWTDNESGSGLNYTVQLERALGAAAFALVATLPNGSVSYVDTGLTANTGYRYRVRMVSGSGPSGYSAVLSVTTAAPAANTDLASVVPQILSISGVAGDSRTLHYTALDANGSTKPGVTIALQLSNAAVAHASPAAAVTDSQGEATFVVSLLATGQAHIAATATDGVATLSAAQIPTVSVLCASVIDEVAAAAILETQSLRKYAEDVEIFTLDFTEDISAGETLVGDPVMELIPAGSKVATDETTAMLLGSPTIAGPYVVQYVRGGTPGGSYYLRARCDTSLGERFTAELRFSIYPTIGRKARSL